jgi:hypothetical protein
MVGRNLNPFKRRRDKPVAFWSGVRDVGPAGGDFTFTVPDYFNGTLRVMAVAVNEDVVGATEVKSVVRGDFVLNPNVPLMVAPGDTFEVSLGVANNVVRSGKGAQIQVGVQASPQLEVLGPAATTLTIDEMRGIDHVPPARAQSSATPTSRHRVGGRTGRIAASLASGPPCRTVLPSRQAVCGSERVRSGGSRPLPELRTVRAVGPPAGVMHGL